MFETLALPSPEGTAIEVSEPFVYTGDLHLGDGLDDLERQRFMRQETSGVGENWRLDDVTLFPAFGLVFKDDDVVEATRFCVFQGEEEIARRYIAGAHLRREAGRFFQCLNRCSANYFHTLIQVLPAIAGYAAFPGFQEGTLFLHKPGPIFFRALELAAITLPRTEIVSPAVPLDVHDLTFSSYLSHRSLISIFSRSIFDRMIASVSPEDTRVTAHPIIYAWRADTTARVMRNEDELVERLIERFDIHPAVLSALTLDEQIMLFQGVRVVVGPHGAGLANIVFCRPDTVLYELIPHHYVNPALNHLAQLGACIMV